MPPQLITVKGVSIVLVHEDYDTINIIEVKSTTSRIFSSLGYTIDKERHQIFYTHHI